MSIETHINLVCNKCPQPLAGEDGEKPRAIRKRAKAEGWTATKKADFCPACSADIAAAMAEAKLGNI